MEAGQTVRGGRPAGSSCISPTLSVRRHARSQAGPDPRAIFTWLSAPLYAAVLVGRDPLLGGPPPVAAAGLESLSALRGPRLERTSSAGGSPGRADARPDLPLLSRRMGRAGPGCCRSRWASFLASVRQIRPRAGAIAASAGVACLLVPRRLLGAARAPVPRARGPFVATSLACRLYFDRKFETGHSGRGRGGRARLSRAARPTLSHVLAPALGAASATFGENNTATSGATKAAAATPLPVVREPLSRAFGPNLIGRTCFWDPVYNEVLAEKIRYDITTRPDLVPRGPRLARREGLRLDDAGAAGGRTLVARPAWTRSRDHTPPPRARAHAGPGPFSRWPAFRSAPRCRRFSCSPEPCPARTYVSLVPYRRGRDHAVRADRRVPRVVLLQRSRRAAPLAPAARSTMRP
jgi:hypothetical protein